MRCVHCGYVSFDEISACRRCGKSLPARPLYPPRSSSAAAFHGEDRFPVAADILLEEEPDWTRLSLPEELQDPSFPSVVYAGFFRRAAAVVVDTTPLYILTILAMILASLTAIGGGTVAGEVTSEVRLFASGAALAMAFAVSLAYHVVCWGYGGQTPGKMLMGVKVVRWDGEEIGYGRAFMRWVAYILALIPFGLGLTWVLFDTRRRGLHDHLAGTCVIRVDVEVKP